MATVAALAETPTATAPEAARKLAAGDLVLLDIRSPQEWAETGVAKGAWPVSMHEPDFPERLQTILSVYGPGQIALICATGGRTSYIADILERNGIIGVLNVAEGMFGNGDGPGWVARGLPVVPLQTAKDAYETSAAIWARE